MKSFFVPLVIFVISISGYADKSYREVYVKDCQNHFMEIYEDSKLTLHLSNPFVSGRDGTFTFFVEGDCVRVRANRWNLWQEFRTGNTAGERAR